MILAIPDLMVNINFSENKIYELIIENPRKFREIVFDLYSQFQGGDGSIILSKDNKEIGINKNTELIINPFDIDINSKKIQSNLYQELNLISTSELYEVSQKTNAVIIQYLDQITQMLPYEMEYSLELDQLGLYKLYKVSLSDDTESLSDKLITYIKLIKKVLNVELVIFVNIKQYISQIEYQELFLSAKYEKINILNIEGEQKYTIDDEMITIVDNDLCTIVLN